MYSGELTGQFDEPTRDVLNEFRARKGLPPQAMITLSTLRLLIQEMEIAELRQQKAQLAEASETSQRRSNVRDREIAGLRQRAQQVEEERRQLEEATTGLRERLHILEEEAARPKTLGERLRAIGLRVWIATAVAVLCMTLLVLWLFVKAKRKAREEAAPVVATPFILQGVTSSGIEVREGVRSVDGLVDLVVGRANADILVDDATVGRQHVRLVGTRDDTRLIDLGSRNGTSVNGQPCERGRSYAIAVNDEIRLGGAVLVLYPNLVDTDD